MSANARLENGVVVFMCGGRRRHTQHCTYCSRPATSRCDFVNVNGAECVALLCGQCAEKRVVEQRTIDNCRIHRLRGGITEITK